MYKAPVSIVDNPKINQWLTLVEKEMRMNLATLLAQAVEDTTHFQTETIDSARYIQLGRQIPGEYTSREVGGRAGTCVVSRVWPVYNVVRGRLDMRFLVASYSYSLVGRCQVCS